MGGPVIDLASSLALLGLVSLALLAYGVRTVIQGRAHFRRVEKDGGSALLGEGAMSAGYWALQPVGAALAALGVTPNGVTLGSLALGGAAALALASNHFGVAAALVAVAALGDVLDGMVARVTGLTSEAGAVLDSTADRYQEFVFLAALAIAYRGNAVWLALVLTALLGSMMTSYVSAKAAAVCAEVPRGAMRRPERALYLTVGAGLTPIVAAVSVGRPAWVSHVPMLAALLAVAVIANVSAVRRLVALMATIAARRPAAVAAPQDPLVHTLGRHQLGSVAATAIDFAALALLVERLGVDPVAATALGSLAGAVTNFALARRWIFRDHQGTAASQALRYALVSGVSLGFNTLGECALATRLGVHYLVARVLVSVTVSLLWNFPMHRRFVFPRAAEAV